MPYKDALIDTGMETLYGRRHIACNKFFSKILEDPNHKLNDLISNSSIIVHSFILMSSLTNSLFPLQVSEFINYLSLYLKLFNVSLIFVVHRIGVF